MKKKLYTKKKQKKQIVKRKDRPIKARKGKGFYTTKTKYTSRRSLQELGKIYDSIMDELSSVRKSKLNKTFTKLQRNFRKKLQEKKSKSKSKKVAKYKSSKFYKTLEELPANLLDKILTKITDKYEIKDDDVKNMVIITILYSNVEKQIPEILNIVKDFHNNILKCLIKWLDYLGQIRTIERGDSSADEEENENIQMEFHGEKMKLREKMGEQGNILGKLLNNRDKIMQELAKIMKIIDSKNSDYKYIEDFIKEFAKDWFNELEKFQDQSYQSSVKIEDDKRELAAKMRTVEEKMLVLLREKILYSEGANLSLLGTIKDSSDKIIDVQNKYNEKLVSEKKSRASSSRSRR
tara:strand:+ start:1 stop:1050 length:1050 start_codon:yes stop_codon:yes gene_type:complete